MEAARPNNPANQKRPRTLQGVGHNLIQGRSIGWRCEERFAVIPTKNDMVATTDNMNPRRSWHSVPPNMLSDDAID